MKESSGKLGELDRADGDVGRRGWLAFTMLLIALCADSMLGRG
jgi:hypothetical protein